MGDVDGGNVISWATRPRRAKKPPPKTYWEEYVETDEWYLAKLLEDVPASEMHAACFDEDVQHDVAAGSGTESEGDASAPGSGDETDASFVCSGSESDDAPGSEDEYTSSDSDSGSTTSTASDAPECERERVGAAARGEAEA